MIDFLKKINRENGVTIIVTSHDMDDLEEMAQRVLMVASGKIVYDSCFDGLRDVTGNLTHLTVTTDGFVPELDHERLLSAENGVFAFEVDLAKTPVKSLLKRLSETDGIQDEDERNRDGSTLKGQRLHAYLPGANDDSFFPYLGWRAERTPTVLAIKCLSPGYSQLPASPY